MKDRILHIIALLLVPLLVTCCSTAIDEQLGAGDGYITLSFKTPGVDVRAEVEDNDFESFMSHLDVVIYKDEGSNHFTPFHHQRIYVSDTPSGRVTISKAKRDFEENTAYRFYVIANSTRESSVFYKNDGSIISHDAFLKLDQTDNYIHLSGIEFGVQGSIYPQMFLMDGVAYMSENEPAAAGSIVINSTQTGEDITLKVVLRRAAAKVQIAITPGDKVTFTKALMALSNGYMVRNMPIRTTLSAAGGYPNTNSGANPYWSSSTISQSPYFQMEPIVDSQGNEINYKINLTLYCYSHTWTSENAFLEGTSVVMMLPLICDSVEYVNNYYQLSFSKSESGTTGQQAKHLIKRNTFYDLRIKLNAPGAEDFNEPEEIKNIQYFTEPWEKIDLDISGENTVKYLKVNKEKLYMYNIATDSSSLYFSSSSPVTVEFVKGSAYYYNKYNTKTTLNDNAVNINGSTESGATSGNITVRSDIPTNNTIRYFQIKVTNQEGMSEIIDVEQYPLIYITNGLPWYSYREDYYYRENSGHSWTGNVSSSPATGDQPTTYQYDGDHIVSVYKINSVDLNTKTVKYTYTSATPSSSGGGTGWTASKVRGDQSGNNYEIKYYHFEYKSKKWSKKESNCETHNVRNYHVRIMASSGDYTLARPALDAYGYTAGDADNAKLVSPSFVIASRLGAVLSTYSGLSNMTNEKKLIAFADHCKNYVEVDDVNNDKKNPVVVYDNWRLPTEAELKIIMQIQGKSGQNADAIDFLLNGGYYMSASGPVFNPKNTDSTTELKDPMQASGVAIRCVRDAF